MSVSEHLWRFPTRGAINNLSARFGSRNILEMQDWEWEVADPERLDERISAYHSGEHDDEERFTMMETMIQSFEDVESALETGPRWGWLLPGLDENVTFHAYSVWDWSDPENDNEGEEWKVTKFLRSVLAKHREEFLQTSS